ncbi:hypothetical protein EDC14_103162 [Hydrogenispora ethanolica]|jgi:hypothetical protein|uniref:Uncharacterized protein n=1 Tax=Hydrogenispora ethanolica TaxID=1082276 RepID=A0A4R1R8L0_HYDET|nr:hypothetical protein [Hydrogenispora ethanolica]TCL61890.1 hypothetical protein EDC14_103162 [Hydrogenispora ethanolica]
MDQYVKVKGKFYRLHSISEEGDHCRIGYWVPPHSARDDYEVRFLEGSVSRQTVGDREILEIS